MNNRNHEKEKPMIDIRDFVPYRNPPRIAVIGDICLDLYYFTGTEGAETSVETGLHSFSVFKTQTDLGAAGNAAINCATLGSKQVDLYGLIGDDPWGQVVLDLAKSRNIGVKGIFPQKGNWQTNVYHKIYSGDEELPRYDMGNMNIPENSSVDKLLDFFESRLDEYQCVIINEQVPSGLHSPYFRERLSSIVKAAKDKVTWFCDCRKYNDLYDHTIRKLNIHEALKILPGLKTSLKTSLKTDLETSPETGNVPHFDASTAAQLLYQRWGLPVALTLGEDGAILYDHEGCHELNALHFIHEIDSVGAGDAFLAGIVTSIGAGLSFTDAMRIGTFSAGVSLGKIRETGHPTAAEIIALSEEADFRYNPVLARNESLARYDDSGEIEIISDEVLKFRKKPQAAIFDHDGTISVLRQGWEEVMREVMTDAVTGRTKRDTKELSSIKNAVNTLIEKTTGVQTLTQMYALKELVHSFGYVKDENILSPAEYKEIYNQKLLAAMEKRVRGVRTGRLSPEDVTIKGAVSFLERLTAAAVKLFLVSGTDQEDVHKEAALLGYVDYFTGGIRGSVGDIKNDPKKIVIRQIIREFSAAGSDKQGRVAVFGDGPVEMREAKKAGFIAIGVLSDERRRYGRNREKRERLILAGADILIPDFSFQDELCGLLGWDM
jgi:sugar/nucleoside kinase (ribokinase family)/phosphoglycolate phosphatase-like HAD superfamily hydrolase